MGESNPRRSGDNRTCYHYTNAACVLGWSCRGYTRPDVIRTVESPIQLQSGGGNRTRSAALPRQCSSFELRQSSSGAVDQRGRAVRPRALERGVVRPAWWALPAPSSDPSGSLCVLKHAGNAQHALVSPRTSRVRRTFESWANNRMLGPRWGPEAVFGVEHFMTWLRGEKRSLATAQAGRGPPRTTRSEAKTTGKGRGGQASLSNFFPDCVDSDGSHCTYTGPRPLLWPPRRVGLCQAAAAGLNLR